MSASVSATTTTPSLAGNRDFNVYWLGQAFSVLGDAFATVATPLLVLQATGSIAKMGLVTAVIGAGHIVAGLVSGAIVDRVDRRRLMIALDFLRTALWLMVPLVWWTRGPNIELLVAVAGVGAMLANIFQVSTITAVASLVERDQITEANGRLHATFAFMYFVGPMLSGVVCHRFGPVTAIAIDASSFVLSAASLMFVRLVRRESSAPPPAATRAELARELLAGVRFLWNDPTLRAVTVLLGLTNALLMARLDLLVYYIKQGLHRNDDTVGAVFAVGALGAVVAGLSTARVRRRYGFGVVWLSAGLLLGLGTALIGATHSLGVLAFATTLTAVADSSRGILSMSVRQEVTPEPLLGRVTAAFWALITVPGALGAAAMTWLAQHSSVRMALAVSGLGTMALMALGFASPLRDRKP